MGYDLTNEQGNYYRFNISGWSPVLSLGRKYGWEPAGTVIYSTRSRRKIGERPKAKIDKTWSGTYFSNDGQTVTRQDALNLANALSNALDHLSNKDLEPKLVAFGDDVSKYKNADRKILRQAISGEDKDKPVTVKKYGYNKGEWFPGKDENPPDVLVVSNDKYMEYRTLIDVNPETSWGGEEAKRYLIGFINFCKEGSFNIY